MSVREHVVFKDVLIRSAGAGDQNSGDCDLVIVVGGGAWDCDSLTPPNHPLIPSLYYKCYMHYICYYMACSNNHKHLV